MEWIWVQLNVVGWNWGRKAGSLLSTVRVGHSVIQRSVDAYAGRTYIYEQRLTRTHWTSQQPVTARSRSAGGGGGRLLEVLTIRLHLLTRLVAAVQVAGAVFVIGEAVAGARQHRGTLRRTGKAGGRWDGGVRRGVERALFTSELGIASYQYRQWADHNKQPQDCYRVWHDFSSAQSEWCCCSVWGTSEWGLVSVGPAWRQTWQRRFITYG